MKKIKRKTYYIIIIFAMILFSSSIKVSAESDNVFYDYYKEPDYRSEIARESLPYFIFFTFMLTAFLILVLYLYIKNTKLNKSLENLVKERTGELLIQAEAAQEASRTKSEFLARMSHEIRTPLNAVIGMAQVVKKNVKEQEHVAASIDEIISASKHLSGILNDVLDIAKIESGKFKLVNEPFSLLGAMHEIDIMLIGRCEEKELNYSSNSDKITDVKIIGDKLRLKQVIINLLGNAVKFTPKGGHVAHSVEVIEDNEKSVTLKFTVSDTGIGISEEQKNNLFIPFEQADSFISRRYGGTGLGLAISQSMAEQMGSVITVDSQLNEGSRFTFTVTFPKAEDELTEYNYEKQIEVLDLTGKHILIVEDIEINRMIITELMADTNAKFHEAENGLRALEMFGNSKEGFYDFILMDIQMPEMDGYEAVKRIRSLERSDAKTVLIYAMTANAYTEDVEKSLMAGMNGHLSKPIEINDVRKLLFEKLL